MPNLIAYLALMLLVPFSIVAFTLLRPAVATAVVLLFAVMFLPERVEFDAPGMPALTKITLSSLCALCGAMVTAPRALARAKPGGGVEVLGLLALVGVIGTVMTNGDALMYGPTFLPGLGPRDVISETAEVVLTLLVPFYLGRALFRSGRDLTDLLRLLAAAGLVYVPFILIELRLSPQWHNWIYGFGQHMFAQTVRAGGYRPMVFMAHGLALAMLVLVSVISAAALARARAPVFGVPASVCALILGAVLVAVKSMGALVYGAAAIVLLFLSTPRQQLAVGVVMAVIVAGYPVMRATGVFPTTALVDVAARVDRERAASLAFRFEQENILLEKANERVWFGWGGFGRNRIFSDEGHDISVTDGAWIVTMGGSGAVGFVTRFGLLLAPLFAARRALKRVHNARERAQFGALALIVALGAVDLLPNGLFSHLPMFLSGCLLGLSGGLRSRAPVPLALARDFSPRPRMLDVPIRT